MFKNTQEPHGGPAVASPPSRSLKVSWMLFMKPCLTEQNMGHNTDTILPSSFQW